MGQRFSSISRPPGNLLADPGYHPNISATRSPKLTREILQQDAGSISPNVASNRNNLVRILAEKLKNADRIRKIIANSKSKTSDNCKYITLTQTKDLQHSNPKSPLHPWDPQSQYVLLNWYIDTYGKDAIELYYGKDNYQLRIRSQVNRKNIMEQHLILVQLK